MRRRAASIDEKLITESDVIIGLPYGGIALGGE
jgi:hypothetical protein